MITFSGRVMPAGPAHRVSLQRKVGTVWRTVATTSTRAYSSSTSTWSLRLAQTVRGAQTYRAVVAGDALHLPAISAANAVRVV